jgi:DNA-binding FadR family transcriptional regulator
MTDIVERLRGWFKDVNAVSAIDLMDEAAAEIERLREAIRRLAEQDATLSVQGSSVTVTLDATLTDEEREAIELSISKRLDLDAIYTLRKLLERLS